MRYALPPEVDRETMLAKVAQWLATHNPAAAFGEPGWYESTGREHLDPRKRGKNVASTMLDQAVASQPYSRTYWIKLAGN